MPRLVERSQSAVNDTCRSGWSPSRVLVWTWSNDPGRTHESELRLERRKIRGCAFGDGVATPFSEKFLPS